MLFVQNTAHAADATPGLVWAEHDFEIKTELQEVPETPVVQQPAPTFVPPAIPFASFFTPDVDD